MDKNKVLLELARRHRRNTNQINNITDWFGKRNKSLVRKYICYICDIIIDTESSSYRATKHAINAIAQHGLFHLQEHHLMVFLDDAKD